MKSTTVQFPLSPDTKVFVSLGDRFAANTAICEIAPQETHQTIAAAEILHVKPHQITKYLKKGIGESFETGQILLEKKNLLSSSFVKSPYNGKLTEVDLKSGTVSLLSKDAAKGVVLDTPFAGKVKEIDKHAITLEIDAVGFDGERGEGEWVSGVLYFIVSEKVGILDISSDVENAILACTSFPPEVSAKFEVLGGRAVIVERVYGDLDVPWIQVGRETYSKLTEYNGKSVWLMPKEKKIYVQA